jgi:hypothetical protein
VEHADPTRITGSLQRLVDLLGQPGPDAATGDPQPGTGVGLGVHGTGTNADERVRAQVSAFGRLEGLTIDPALLRSGAAELAAQVVAAVQAAQDDAKQQSTELLGDAGGPAGTAALREELEGVAAEATRGFDRVFADLDAVLRRLEQR